MATAFENFTLYLAKDLSNPGTSNAAGASDLKITNDAWLKQIFCSPTTFAKRVTDTSNATNQDLTSPDTGTAQNTIELLIREDRAVAGSTLLKNLLKLHFQTSTTDVFRFGRIGLLTDDNPELECKPTELGGYKFMGFFFQPDQNNPSTQLVKVRLDFIGDHTILGAFA